MTTIITNGQEWLFVEVPEGSFNYEVLMQNSGDARLFWDKKENGYVILDDYDEGIDLPSGSYTIHAISDTITEEQAAEVVGMRIIHVLKSGLPLPADEPCAYSGCPSKCTTRHWAMLYEGEYSDDVIGAGMPVCALHSEDSLDAFQSLLRSHNLTARYAVLKRI